MLGELTNALGGFEALGQRGDQRNADEVGARIDALRFAGKEAAEGFYFLSPPVPQDLDTPEARAFLADYQKKYGEAPASIWAVLAGDGFRVAVAGMAGAKSAEGGKIAEYLHKDLKSFSGLSGPISFDAKGDREGDVYRVYQVDAEGKFVLQK